MSIQQVDTLHNRGMEIGLHVIRYCFVHAIKINHAPKTSKIKRGKVGT